MTTPAPIPRTIDEVSGDWLVEVLGEAGYSVPISNLEVTPIGTGQMASSLRLRPSYAEATEAPETLVVKMVSDDPTSRAAGSQGAYLREVRFYEAFAATLAVATPQCYWSAFDADTHAFAILLEDMAPAQQGDQIAGASVEALQAAVANIAGLHAPHWGDESLFDHDWLIAPRREQSDRAAGAHELVNTLMPAFLDRYGSRLEPRHRTLLRWFAESVGDWLIEDYGRFGLCHADHRLDNLLFDLTNSSQPVTVVDWQTVTVRNPLADVAYLLGTSLEAPDRRAAEHDLVNAYCAQLQGLGVDGVDQATCFEDYRRQTPHSLLLTVLGSMLTIQTDRGDDMFMAMLHRSSQQMFDLDVL